VLLATRFADGKVVAQSDVDGAIMRSRHTRVRISVPDAADVAQLVERNLAKVEVAGSIPVVRSGTPCSAGGFFASGATSGRRGATASAGRVFAQSSAGVHPPSGNHTVVVQVGRVECNHVARASILPLEGPIRESRRRHLTRVSDSDARLTVAIVAESFLPAVNGVTNSVVRIAEELTRAGHRCIVIAPGPGVADLDGIQIIRVRSFDLPRYGDLRVGLPTARMAALLRKLHPDVVHLAAPAVLGAAAALAARRLGIPTVAIYQTDIAGFASRHRLGVARNSIWRWVSWVHRQADLTLAPSTAAMWTLRRHGVADVARWARGVDLARFSPAHRDDEIRRALLAGVARHGDAHEPVVVGYVGRLAPEKQVHRLRPVLDLAGVRLVVVGDGPARTSLERSLRGSAFLGLCHGAELATIYASLDVFVHTGLDETFCQSVQEALASGVPVVAPSSGGPVDLVQHGHNGYLWNPAAPESLVGAVGDLAASPELRTRLGAAARSSVLARPWSALTAELVGHYRDVIHRVSGDASVRPAQRVGS
jgi:phosphatidylinositol alpha 1,6-mannosyltransferase